MSHFYDSQTTFNFTFIICSQSELLWQDLVWPSFFCFATSMSHLHTLLSLLFPLLEIREGIWLGMCNVIGGALAFSSFSKVLITTWKWSYISERSMMCPYSLSFFRNICSSGLRFSLRNTLMLLVMSSKWGRGYFPWGGGFGSASFEGT